MNQNIADKFKKHGFNFMYFETRQEAVAMIKDMINKDDLIAFGGSTTLNELGLVDYLVSNHKNTLNRYANNLTSAEKTEVERQGLLSDIFICGTNAISEDGAIVNIDRIGNRTAAQIFGPKKVFIVAGINKLCPNTDEAIKRARTISAPKNAKRLEANFTTGCQIDGTCRNCNFDGTICHSYTVIKNNHFKNRINIFLINEILGF